MQAVPLHVQGLGLVGCLQNLEQKQQRDLPSAQLRCAVHKHCPDPEQVTPLSQGNVSLFHYKPESVLNYSKINLGFTMYGVLRRSSAGNFRSVSQPGSLRCPSEVGKNQTPLSLEQILLVSQRGLSACLVDGIAGFLITDCFSLA